MQLTQEEKAYLIKLVSRDRRNGNFLSSEYEFRSNLLNDLKKEFKEGRLI